jgi:vancomycin permeability regulator SanA
LAFPAIVLGEVPRTSATSLGGILEILVYVLPSVRENTQKFANIISKNPISINKKNFLNMSKIPPREVALVLGTSPKTMAGNANPYFISRMDATSLGGILEILVY